MREWECCVHALAVVTGCDHEQEWPPGRVHGRGACLGDGLARCRSGVLPAAILCCRDTIAGSVATFANRRIGCRCCRLKLNYASSNTRGFSVKSAHCTTQSGKGQQLVQDGDWLHDFCIVRQRADLLPGSLRCAGSLKLAMKVRIGGNHRTPIKIPWQSSSRRRAISPAPRAPAPLPLAPLRAHARRPR